MTINCFAQEISVTQRSKLYSTKIFLTKIMFDEKKQCLIGRYECAIMKSKYINEVNIQAVLKTCHKRREQNLLSVYLTKGR